MSDQFKHSPINIPIASGDDDVATDSADVIEIDGDDLVYDPDDLIVDDEADIEVEVVPESESDDPVSRRPTVTESIDPYIPPPASAEAEAVQADSAYDNAIDATEVDSDDGVLAAAAIADDGAIEADVDDAPGVTAGGETTTVSKQAVIDLMQELRQKSESISRLSEERTDLYDKLLRKQAEFENFRKRGEREMQEAYVRARADLLSDLLPVLDNFDLAVQHADTSNPDAVREGVHLIHKQLFDSLFRLGLEPIEADGQPFDPELHEAVATEPTDEAPDHTILIVLQRGYRLGDRLLRPARVKVAVTP